MFVYPKEIHEMKTSVELRSIKLQQKRPGEDYLFGFTGTPGGEGREVSRPIGCQNTKKTSQGSRSGQSEEGWGEQ